jgi:hypothetical protein
LIQPAKVVVVLVVVLLLVVVLHCYNIIKIHGKSVKIATIDTMLSFYLSFLYTNREYYNEFSERILCMSKFLFDVQQKNRLEQKGLLKRFSIICYGHQESVEEMRAEKAAKFIELKNAKNTKEYEEWFLRYRPIDKVKKITETPKNKKIKTTKKKPALREKTRRRGRGGLFI